MRASASTPPAASATLVVVDMPAGLTTVGAGAWGASIAPTTLPIAFQAELVELGVDAAPLVVELAAAFVAAAPIPPPDEDDDDESVPMKSNPSPIGPRVRW